MRQQEAGTTTGALSREVVLTGAVALADQIGVEPLTIRKLADALGSKPMTLYSYVKNKDDILSAIEMFKLIVEANWVVVTRDLRRCRPASRGPGSVP